MKTSGYSGTPLYKKLGLRAGDRAWFSGAPPGYDQELRRAGSFENCARLTRKLDFVHLLVCAVNETWSGLKFVFRLKDR